MLSGFWPPQIEVVAQEPVPRLNPTTPSKPQRMVTEALRVSYSSWTMNKRSSWSDLSVGRFRAMAAQRGTWVWQVNGRTLLYPFAAACAQ